jgi:hypothetical protein
VSEPAVHEGNVLRVSPLLRSKYPAASLFAAEGIFHIAGNSETAVPKLREGTVRSYLRKVGKSPCTAAYRSAIAVKKPEAQRLKAGLEAIDGLMVMDTQTHYMLVNIDWANVLELKNWLVEHHGILIRDASNFHGLDDHCFRVAAQTPEENDALLNAIKAYQQEKQG